MRRWREAACRCGRLSRLSLNFRQRRIHTSPTRRGRCPDIGGGSGQFLIVESASPDYQEVGTAIGCTEKRGSASRTKAAAHGITAVGGAPVFADLTCDLYPFGLEYSVDGGVAGGEISLHQHVRVMTGGSSQVKVTAPQKHRPVMAIGVSFRFFGNLNTKRSPKATAASDRVGRFARITRSIRAE